MSDDVALLDGLSAAVSGAVGDLDEVAAARPTRTAAWTVRELLLHQLLDARRALVAFASPVEAEVDVDAVTYWRPFRPSNGDGGRAHAAFVQRSAAAYDSFSVLVEEWRTTAAAVVRAARASAANGHVSTLVVEATVHLLDLTLHVPGGPSEAAVARTRDVLTGVLGAPLPAGWDDREAVLKATGRLLLDAADRSVLGPLAARFPLLG